MSGRLGYRLRFLGLGLGLRFWRLDSPLRLGLRSLGIGFFPCRVLGPGADSATDGDFSGAVSCCAAWAAGASALFVARVLDMMLETRVKLLIQ